MIFLTCFSLFLLIFISLHMTLRMLQKDQETISLRLQFIKNDLTEFQEQVVRKKIKPGSPLKNLIHSASTVLVKFTPKKLLEDYQQKIKSAGVPYGLKAQDWLGIQIAASLILPAVTLFLFWNSQRLKILFLLALVEFIFGLGIPRFLLARAQKLRLNRIQEDLPSAIDFLTICIEAGGTFDTSMSKIVEKMKGPISEEFDILLKEIKLGATRTEAFEALEKRVPLDDMKTFVRAVTQSEKMGARVGNTLKTISEDIRENKRMRLKARIGKAVIKILIPLVVFIMPTILIIIMGPVVLKMVKVVMGLDFSGFKK